MRRVPGWHFILGFYGFWLPNDPRGSGSDYVRSRHLYAAGGAATRHLADGERSVAHRRVDPHWRRRAYGALRHAPVRLNGIQARAVAQGLARAIEEGGYVVWRCGILQQHVHLVTAPSVRRYGAVAGHLKARVTQQLRAQNLHPFLDDAGQIVNPLWGRRCRCRFITGAWWLAGALRYVGENPVREGLPRQRWWFEVPCPVVEAREEGARPRRERRRSGV